MNDERILVGMSGGVDSAVAALLLARAGAEVVGAYMKNWINEDELAGECPWQRDIEDARATAAAIGIEFKVVNLMREYRERVVNYLLEGYRRGETPNPDTMCNREIKFGAFLQWARREGFDAVATGHYVIRRQIAPGRFGLFEGADPDKDQSYFLALLGQEQLAGARFPIGHLRKSEVRALARNAGLPVAAKKDSQGICFIGRVRMTDFLRHYLPDAPGDIVRVSDGAVVGQHRGVHLFTIGQRRGIGVPSNTDHHNYVVVGRDPSTNRLLVAFESPDAPGLWTQKAVAGSLRFVDGAPPASGRLEARVRYRDPRVAVGYELASCPETGRLRAHIAFDHPQRALAPGQVLALYDGPRLLGGGIFEQTAS